MDQLFLNEDLYSSLQSELREVNAQIDVHSKALNGLLDQKKRLVAALIRKLENESPVIIEYRGNPKRYVSVLLAAIDKGRLTYNGIPNREQTIRSLSSVINVISPQNGKVLSVETLVSYEKKEHNGDFTDFQEGVFE